MSVNKLIYFNWKILIAFKMSAVITLVVQDNIEINEKTPRLTEGFSKVTPLINIAVCSVDSSYILSCPEKEVLQCIQTYVLYMLWR